MSLIADLHIHSPYSRATSPTGLVPILAAWAQIKGIQIVGSGDFTHPAWQKHLRTLLEPAEAGLFQLKKDIVIPEVLPGVMPTKAPVRFMLTAEISSIYKKDGKVRKIHNILFAPDFAAVARLSAAFAAIGNIEADGRPILGLDARDLLEINLEKNPDGFLVPAHIWTPWFSLFGSKSGFDDIEECFGDLSAHIFALETGLSSDPEMNRLISALDRFSLMSNSDSHSPSKLGREANIFTTDLDFFALRTALAQPSQGFEATIEFYPEEGKYHLDGHRQCQICLQPAHTRANQGLCPRCGKPVTVGVLHRVMELADRETPLFPPHSPAVHSLIPLAEVLGEIVGTSAHSNKVMQAYCHLIQQFGSEFNLLLYADLAHIRTEHSGILAEAVRRMRTGEVIRQGGYDGEYGVIRVFHPEEKHDWHDQMGLFATSVPPRGTKKRPTPATLPPKIALIPPHNTAELHLNSHQAQAVCHHGEHVLVSAGPGTGKTLILAARIAHLLQHQQVPPAHIAAITFTRRAAAELRQRVHALVGEHAAALWIGTLHGFVLHWLRQRQPHISVIDHEQRHILLKRLFPELESRLREEVSQEITRHFEALNSMLPPLLPEIEFIPSIKATSFSCHELGGFYLAFLRQNNSVELAEIVPLFLQQADAAIAVHMQQAVAWLCVDEFQDLDAAQYAFISWIGQYARIFAIGDPLQAIYAFRGASPQFFKRFEQEFKPTHIFLQDNYRNSAPILAAAQALMQADYPELQPMHAHAPPLHNMPLLWFQADTCAAEAEWVAVQIEHLIGGSSHRTVSHSAAPGLAFADIAVLYRFKQHSESINAALEKRGLPVQQVDAAPFFQRDKELRALCAYVQCADHANTLNYTALAAHISGIGSRTVAQLERIPLDADFSAAWGGYSAHVRTRLQQMVNHVAAFRAALHHNDLAHALKPAIDFLRVSSSSGLSRFLNLAGVFGADLAAFAAYIRQSAGVYDPRAEAITLMSLHAAKGLEFAAVFIIGVEKNLIPCTHPLYGAPADEEQRLFYVGMTRARQRLFLSMSQQRQLFGTRLPGAPSPFIAKIPPNLIQTVTPQTATPQTTTPFIVQASLF
jgi:DNA helicase II / ATP-dependent DNA helicase PcrA